jgi:hypothetical protein
MDEAMNVAARNFLEVTEGREFQYLKAEHFARLLGRDDVKVDCELEIFNR